jgi:hypothetical protein
VRTAARRTGRGARPSKHRLMPQQQTNISTGAAGRPGLEEEEEELGLTDRRRSQSAARPTAAKIRRPPCAAAMVREGAREGKSRRRAWRPHVGGVWEEVGFGTVCRTLYTMETRLEPCKESDAR